MLFIDIGAKREKKGGFFGGGEDCCGVHRMQRWNVE